MLALEQWTFSGDNSNSSNNSRNSITSNSSNNNNSNNGTEILFGVDEIFGTKLWEFYTDAPIRFLGRQACAPVWGSGRKSSWELSGFAKSSMYGVEMVWVCVSGLFAGAACLTVVATRNVAKCLNLNTYLNPPTDFMCDLYEAQSVVIDARARLFVRYIHTHIYI